MWRGRAPDPRGVCDSKQGGTRYRGSGAGRGDPEVRVRRRRVKQGRTYCGWRGDWCSVDERPDARPLLGERLGARCSVDELLRDAGGVHCKARVAVRRYFLSVCTSLEALANSHHSVPMRVTVLRIRVRSVFGLTSHVLGASDSRARCEREYHWRAVMPDGSGDARLPRV